MTSKLVLNLYNLLQKWADYVIIVLRGMLKLFPKLGTHISIIRKYGIFLAPARQGPETKRRKTHEQI